MVAAWNGHADIVKLLQEHKADANAVNRERQSARMLAESEGHRTISNCWREVIFYAVGRRGRYSQ
jgi:ankyrin repeat protein